MISILIHTHIYISICKYNDEAGESHSQNFPGQWDDAEMYFLTPQQVSWMPKGICEGNRWKYSGSLALLFASLTGSFEARG